jgi:hypothetical protein
MATPGELVETMAHVLGVPAATVSQYDRQLAEAGLRASGGRGTSAAKVTATDAANLLIAILGAPISGASIKAACQMCETLGAFPARRRLSSTRKFGKFGFDTLGALPRTHTFRDAVSALIEGVSVGEPFKKSGRTQEFLPWGHFLNLNVDSPALSAQIAFHRGPSSAEMALLVYDLEDRNPPSGVEFKPDLRQQRRVSFMTIKSLGNLIAAENN